MRKKVVEGIPVGVIASWELKLFLNWLDDSVIVNSPCKSGIPCSSRIKPRFQTHEGQTEINGDNSKAESSGVFGVNGRFPEDLDPMKRESPAWQEPLDVCLSLTSRHPLQVRFRSS